MYKCICKYECWYSCPISTSERGVSVRQHRQQTRRIVLLLDGRRGAHSRGDVVGFHFRSWRNGGRMSRDPTLPSQSTYWNPKQRRKETTTTKTRALVSVTKTDKIKLKPTVEDKNIYILASNYSPENTLITQLWDERSESKGEN